MTDLPDDRPLQPLSIVQQATIAIAVISMGVGMTISFVVASPLARDAGLNELQVAGILTLSAFFYALLTPAWGRLANRIGRKRVMIFSLCAMGATNALFNIVLDAALAGMMTGLTTFLSLLVARLSFGLLSPGLQPSVMAAMTDATTVRNRAAGMGIVGVAMSVGSVLGPGLATVMAPFGALAPLWASVVLSFATAGLVAVILPPAEGATGRGRPAPLRFRDPRVLPYIGFLFAYFIGIGAIQQTLAWLVQDRYLLDRAAAVQSSGIAYSIMAVCLVIVQFGYVNRVKPDPRQMLPVGLALIACGYVAAALTSPFWALCLSFVSVGCGSAFVVPAANALATLAVTPDEQGAAAALVSAAPPAGFVVGPLVGAALYMAGSALPLLVCALMMSVLFAYATLVLRHRPIARTG